MADPVLDTPAPAPALDTPAPVITANPPVTDPAPVDPAIPADPAVPVVGDWPEDWRSKYSADPKIVKRLERYASPKAALDALFAAQTRISSGELKSALKADATIEEKAQWREENGIPATPTEYDTTLPNGLVMGEADKELVNEFLSKAHESNMHPSQVKETLGWFFDRQEQARVAQEARDTEGRMAGEDELRAEFGTDYRRNVALAYQLLEGAPDGVKDTLLAGRTADGKAIGNDPVIIRWLVGLSRELNPVGTVVPGSGTNAVQAAETELGALRKMMGDHKSEYWKGATANKNQARYRELTTALQKGKAA